MQTYLTSHSKHYCISHGVAIITFASALTNKNSKHNMWQMALRKIGMGRITTLQAVSNSWQTCHSVQAD